MTVDSRCFNHARWNIRALLLCMVCLAAFHALAQQPDAPAAEASDTRLRITSQRQLFSPALKLYQFFGEVTAESPTVRISADELTYDDARGQAVASGHVEVVQAGQSYRGDSLTYLMANGTWHFTNLAVTIPPESLGEPMTGPLFLHSKLADSTDTGLTLEQSQVTTCDLDNPHYALVARQVEIYPGDRLIARDVDLYALGKRIVHLPWFYLPLDGRRPLLMPEVGQNDVEGYFLRVPYQYALSPDEYGVARLDLTQKRGVGLGVDHRYALLNGKGEFLLYGSQGSGDYTAWLRHSQPLPGGIHADLSLDRSRSTAYTVDPVTQSNDSLRLTRSTAHSDSQLSLTHRLSLSQYRYESTGANFTQQLTGDHDIFQYTGDYSRLTAGTTEREDLWNRASWTHKLSAGDLQLRVDHHTIVPTGDGYASSSDIQRLPEVTFSTSAERLGLHGQPGTLRVGWGMLQSGAAGNRIQRYLFDMQSGARSLQVGATKLTAQTGFQQMVYLADQMTARYQLQGGLTAVTQLGPVTNNLQYTLQRGAGYTPLTMDISYPRHTISDSLQCKLPSGLLTLTGGRDLLQQRWQDITLNLEMRPLKQLSMRHSLGYDPNHGDWRNLISRYSWLNDDRLAVSLNTQIDLNQRALRLAGADVRWKVNPQWSVTWQAGYDATNDRFYANRWYITRDLHCWEAALYADIAGNSYGFTFYPKALGGGLLPQFSIGQGQSGMEAGVGVAF